MAISEGVDGSLLDLPAEVAERVVAELPDQGEKVVRALRTASVLIAQALGDETGLRFAESAAYNLREALDAVVAERPPVRGGLPVVIEAWERFEHEVTQPGNDDAASREAFSAVLRSAKERQDRNSYHQARLLDYVRDKAGVDPLDGDLDPVVEYNRLRSAANERLHKDAALDSVTRLYQTTLAWFVRMFTPPGAVVLALRRLAAEPWRGTDQIDRLRELASNPHHLRLFFAYLVDPAWLDPLYEAGVVRLPVPRAPWPVASLSERLGRTAPAAVAALVRKLLACCGHLRVEERLNARFRLLVLATELGPEGHTIVGDVAALCSGNRSVRSFVVGAVKRADPADPIVERVGDVMLNGGPLDHDSYYYRSLLEHLEAGMNPENAETRTRMVAAKLRKAARRPGANGILLDLARLTTDLGDEDRGFLVVASHYLARLVVRARALGVPDRRLLDWVTGIPGEVGERLTCRVLAMADDIPLQDKIDHVTCRLASQTATGDDKDLIDTVLAANPDPHQLAAWTDALGSPTDPQADPAVLPQDWRKAWRWSVILPGHLLARWQEPIAALSAQHGRVGLEVFDHRVPTSYAMWGRSPYSVEELAALPVLDAANLVAAWRPDADSDRRMTGPHELARVLRTVVAADPQAWTADPATVVRTLREPLYVRHYFLALAEKPTEIQTRTGNIIATVRLAATEKWAPIVLGNDHFDLESDWRSVDTAVVDLVTVLADHDAPFADSLDTAWNWALSALEPPPGADRPTADDPLNSAANPREGLQAVLSLADWEHRNIASIRPQFLDTLDNVVHVTGSSSMVYRAILASQLIRLERIAQNWLDRRIDILFRADNLGPATVDLVLKSSRYTTPWLHRNLRNEIITAALRGTEDAVVSLLTGTLKGEPGYDIDTIITALRKEPAVLARAAECVAYLVQKSCARAPELDMAVQFWRALLDANRNVVPLEVLRCTGRWAFVAGLPDNTWASLMARTLVLTEGLIDYPIEVAERCEAVPIPGDSSRILLLLQGRGEPWEQHRIAHVALSALRTLSSDRPDGNFRILQTRLIELGYDEATDLTPYEDQS